MSEGANGGLANSTLTYYALPAAVLALPTIPIYIHLPALYGVEFGLGLTTTGLILLAARIFDTVTDPLVGALSDRLRFFLGRRMPWIGAGALVAGLGLFKILNPPDEVEAHYLLAWSAVLYAGWTMFAVPYLAWGGGGTHQGLPRTHMHHILSRGDDACRDRWGRRCNGRCHSTWRCGAPGGTTPSLGPPS